MFTNTCTSSHKNNVTQKALISSKSVRLICGEISEMSLWRWLNTPNLNFPRPIKIMRRNYWRLDDIHEWLKTHDGSAS
jgi:predicted DNA-binding transcriptional regulator AlpA